MASFDWYQATVPHPVNDVLEVLSGMVPGLALGHQRGLHGYAATAALGSEAHGVVAKVMHGGSHEYPHAVVSGEWAQAGAELIRAAFPKHRVSRMDVREDFVDPGAYDAIQPHLLAAADSHRVKVGTAGDHLLTMKGRTCYLGAPSSAVRMRLYDKREEVLAKLPPGASLGPDVPEHWARLEAQIRPHGRLAKSAFASIEPKAALGCTEWMRDIWAAVAGLELQPVQVGPVWRPSDHERAYRVMRAQYRRVLERLHQDAGSWECVGLQIGEDLANDFAN